MKSEASSPKARAALRRFSAGAILLSFLAVGAAVAATPAAAQTAQPCTAPTAPAAGAIAKNIDTTQGCDVSTGAASNPTTGYFAVTMPTGISGTNPGTLYDAFQEGMTVFNGTYTLTFSNCVGGTATGGTYTVSNNSISGAGGNVTANTAGGTVSCAYSVAYSGQPPSGTTLRNLIQLTFANGQTVAAASPAVQRFAAAEIPEAPIAVLLPVVGVLAGGVVLIVRRRRSQPLVAH